MPAETQKLLCGAQQTDLYWMLFMHTLNYLQCPGRWAPLCAFSFKFTLTFLTKEACWKLTIFLLTYFLLASWDIQGFFFNHLKYTYFNKKKKLQLGSNITQFIKLKLDFL